MSLFVLKRFQTWLQYLFLSFKIGLRLSKSIFTFWIEANKLLNWKQQTIRKRYRVRHVKKKEKKVANRVCLFVVSSFVIWARRLELKKTRPRKRKKETCHFVSNICQCKDRVRLEIDLFMQMICWLVETLNASLHFAALHSMRALGERWMMINFSEPLTEQCVQTVQERKREREPRLFSILCLLNMQAHEGHLII